MIENWQFVPHPLLANGHLQTLAGVYLPQAKHAYAAAQHRIELASGDVMLLHDDCPECWQPAGGSVLLLHGLCGSHSSNYMARIGAKLNGAGHRVWRLDFAGCGPLADQSSFGTHGASWNDLVGVVEHIQQLAPQSPLAVIGFSLGASLALNLAAEVGSKRLGNWRSVMAVSPPVDFIATSRHMQRGLNRQYDRFFARQLCDLYGKHVEGFADSNPRPKTLWQFDDQYTATVAGFAGAEEYYTAASVAPRLARIELPTVIITAADDPIVPADPLLGAELGPLTQRLVTPSGGHIGFVGRGGVDPDRRWIDWRVLEFVSATLGLLPLSDSSTELPMLAEVPA